MSRQLSRRRFIKHALAASTASLALGPMAKLAFAQGIAKLKVVFAVMPDGFGVDAYGGYNNGLWYPDVSGTESTRFALNEMSQHLGDYKKQALFLRGLLLSTGTGGHNAWTAILRDSNASKTSIDLILADAMPGTNPALKRLYSGPHAMVGASWNISYSGSNMLLPEDDPYQLFNTVYGDFQTILPTAKPTNNTHLFDPVIEDITALKNILGNAEKAKLQTHLDAVEQVASDIRNTLEPSGECNPGNAVPEENMSIHSADFREPVTRAHANILASALSCGMSRVATFQIGRSADPVVIKTVSTSRNPHDCAHRYGDVREWKESRAWYVKQVRYLLDRLSAFPDPDVPGDSLLDHTLVVFTSEMADGAPEHMQDLPITLIGGASGLLNNGSGSGRYLDLSPQGERSHWKLGQCTDVQRVWATLARAAGTSVPYAGDVSTLTGVFNNV